MNRIVFSAAMVLTFSLFGASFGCQTNNSDDNIQDSAIIETLKKLPIYCDMLFFVDMGAVREDPFPLPDIPGFLAGMEEVSDELGLDIEELDYVGMGIEGLEAVSLLGDFNLDAVADELDNNDEYERDEYKGIDIWEDSQGGWTALLPGCIIGGSRDAVTGCIRVIQDNDKPLYDNHDLRAVVERLPNHTFTMCGRFAPVESPDDYGAVSFQGTSERAVEVTLVQDFKDKDTAEERTQEVESFVAGLGQDLDPLQDFHITQDDRFIITTIEMDTGNVWSIGDMLNSN